MTVARGSGKSTATKGLISDFDIMQAANKAMLLGLPVTTESMGTMAKAATVLGRAMGQDATKSLDDLTTALGRGSPLILDNLGLTVKVGEANAAYARQLGKTTSQLTEGEKKMAFYNAAMEAAKVKVAELGGVTLTAADHLAVMQTMWQNFTDRTSVQVSAAIADILNGLGGWSTTAQEVSDATSTMINVMLNGFVNMARIGGEAIETLVQAFSGGIDTIGSQLGVLKDMLTGKVGPLQGLRNLGTLTYAGAQGIRNTLGGFSPEFSYTDYAAAGGGPGGRSAPPPGPDGPTGDPRTKAHVGNTIGVALNMNSMHIFDRQTELAIR